MSTGMKMEDIVNYDLCKEEIAEIDCMPGFMYTHYKQTTILGLKVVSPYQLKAREIPTVNQSIFPELLKLGEIMFTRCHCKSVLFITFHFTKPEVLS